MSISNILPNKAQGLGTHLIQGTVIGVVLTALSYLVGLQFNWLDTIEWLEVAAVFGPYLATFLCVVERHANYPIGAVANGLYSLLFYQWGLYASSIVTGALTAYLAYGWFRWGKDENTRPVTRLETKWIPAYVLSTAAFYGLVVWFVSMAGGTLAATDSVILIGTVIAQLLLDNKKIETWAVWIVVNVFAIYTYFNAGLTLAGFQYIFFLLNAFYGFYMWKKSKDDDDHYIEETLDKIPEVTFTPDRVRRELGLKPLYTDDALGNKKSEYLMKVIKPGTPEKRWPREWTAPCCKSVLEIEPEDIKEDTDYTGGHNSWFVNCPVCGGQPDVPDNFKYDANRWLEQQSRVVSEKVNTLWWEHLCPVMSDIGVLKRAQRQLADLGVDYKDAGEILSTVQKHYVDVVFKAAERYENGEEP